MKININIEIDTDSESDKKEIERILDLLQQLHEHLEEKSDE